MNEGGQQKKLDRDNGISGIVIASVGYMVVLFLPVFLDVASRELDLTDAQVGLLGTTDSASLSVATLLCAMFINRLNFPITAMVGVAVAVLGNALSVGVTDFDTLCGVRLITGFGEGLLVAVGISAVGMTSNPDRWFGLYTAAIVLVQAFGLMVVVPVFNAWQLSGVFIMLAIIYLVPLSLLWMLPGRSVEQAVGINTGTTRVLMLALLATLFFYICIGGVWAYISLMGTDTGLSLEYVSIALTLSMVTGFVGAVFYAAIGIHANRYDLLVISTLVMVVCLWFLSRFGSGLSYTAIISVYGFFWSVIAARLFAVISVTDKSGRYISAAQTVVGVGFAIGPYLASRLVSVYGYGGINAMGALALLLCLAFVTPLARRTMSAVLSPEADMDRSKVNT